MLLAIALPSYYVLLQRAVLPQMDCRCSCWPPQVQIASEIDRTQRKMVATILGVVRLPDEAIEDFVKRRGRLAARCCKQNGLWSKRWFQRAVRWDEHLARQRDSESWSSKIRCYRDRSWLMQRRLDVGSSSAIAGRTNTRSAPGKVHSRWHDAIHYARSLIRGSE